MSTHARPLAVRLATASDEQLAELFARRGVRHDAPWHDFFDAAEALLDPASIDRVLPALTRDEAIVLHGRAAGDDAQAPADTDVLAALTALALLRDDGTPPPPVAEAVLRRERPAPATAPAPDAPAAASEPAAAHAAERAFTTLASLADVLLAIRDTPLTLLATGAVSSGEKKRLAEGGIPADAVDDLVQLGIDAGLARARERRLLLTERGERWLARSMPDRWAELAEAFRRALPRGLRTPEGGWPPPATWDGRHPWDPAWPERAAALRRRAGLLGLIAEGDTEPAWAAPLRAGAAPDPEPLRRMLPAEVDRIFLQNDLTAIAPGPLAPALDVRLRQLAVRESAAQASSYRFTAESLSRGLASGETEASMLAFLGELSLTGIPQPLAYLIAQTAQRHGLIRVRTDAGTGRTRVESADRHLLETIAIDQALRPLGLTWAGADLATRVGRDTVFWALTDARYPATIVGDDGTIETVQRHPLADDEDDDGDRYAPLIARLRAQQGPDADAAWLDRELEAAVRGRAVLVVEVAMPDGSTRELTLEASGLGGGRLRGRDRAADVERTLPVSSIRSARLLEQ